MRAWMSGSGMEDEGVCPAATIRRGQQMSVDTSKCTSKCRERAEDGS
jgi:hypothetical protein